MVSCGVGPRCASDLAWLWLWCRPAAVALIRPLIRTQAHLALCSPPLPPQRCLRREGDVTGRGPGGGALSKLRQQVKAFHVSSFGFCHVTVLRLPGPLAWVEVGAGVCTPPAAAQLCSEEGATYPSLTP